MALDKLQKQSLKRIVQGDDWDVIMVALKEYIDELAMAEVTGNNEFEALRALHTKQGKIDGLKEFFDKIEKNDLT